MRINSVVIEKFRSIKKVAFEMNDITAVVGVNNSGKTAILRAINSVLNYSYEEASFVNRHHQHTSKTNSHITIEFSDIPGDFQYPELIVDSKLTIKFSYIYSESKRKISVLKNRKWETKDPGLIDEISRHFTYVYIPTGRSNKDISWNENSVFYEAVTAFTNKYAEGRDRLSKSVREASKKIHDTVLSKLETQINQFYMQGRDVSFSVNFSDKLDYTSLLSDMEISYNDHGKEYPLKECGSGIKSLAIVALHRTKSTITGSSILLGIEEPEMNLHPQAQKRFIMSLTNTLKTDGIQAIFTTHSTVLIDILGHEDILLVRRIKDESRGFVSKANKLPSDFFEKYHLERFKHYQFFDYRNSDFFFSKYVIVGESKNDCQVFEQLIKERLTKELADVSFINAGGIEGIKYPFFLLKELEIPFMLIVDKDFFFPYENNNILNDSRDSKSGLPRYANSIKESDVLNSIFKTDLSKNKLLETSKKGNRAFFAFISQYKVLSMNYCLEMDLTCSTKAREQYYNILHIPPENQNQNYLLLHNGKSIKDIEKITTILSNIPKSSYPESYAKIKNILIGEIIQATRS